MLPPTRLPYILLQTSDLRGPRPTSGEDMVSRLRLAAVTQPALACVGFLYLVVEVGPNRRLPREEPVIATGQTSSCGGVASSVGLSPAGACTVTRPGNGRGSTRW